MSDTDTNTADCTHSMQVRVEDEWLCENCMAVMDSDDPNKVVAR